MREAEEQTLIVADGFSCREQIAQTTERQALHPAQVLKMALDDRNGERNDALPEHALHAGHPHGIEQGDDARRRCNRFSSRCRGADRRSAQAQAAEITA